MTPWASRSNGPGCHRGALPRYLLNENESIYVQCGTCHRLENPGKIDLELIEVQTGSYSAKTTSCDTTTIIIDRSCSITMAYSKALAGRQLCELVT